MKEYLFAYITRFDKIETIKIRAKTQKEAIDEFYLQNCVDEIIAITEIEQ